MEKQCAGCGTVFEDGQEPKGVVHPRPYGCCPDCNSTQFRTHEHNEVKAPLPKGVGHTDDPELIAHIGEGRGVREDGTPYPNTPMPEALLERLKAENEANGNVITVDHKDGVDTVTEVQRAEEPSDPPKNALDSLKSVQ